MSVAARAMVGVALTAGAATGGYNTYTFSQASAAASQAGDFQSADEFFGDALLRRRRRLDGRRDRSRDVCADTSRRGGDRCPRRSIRCGNARRGVAVHGDWGVRLDAAPSAAQGGTSLVTMDNAAYNFGTVRNIAGYEVGGNAGLVGNTYNVNVWGLYSTQESQGLAAL